MEPTRTSRSLVRRPPRVRLRRHPIDAFPTAPGPRRREAARSRRDAPEPLGARRHQLPGAARTLVAIVSCVALGGMLRILGLGPIAERDSVTLFAPGQAAAAERILVVANTSVPIDTLEVVELQRIYLSKRTRWPDDTRVVATMLKDGPVHRTFVEQILDRTLAKFATYWKQIVFTGQGVPPKSFETEDDLLDFVAETPGAIGYVSARTGTEGVRVLPLAR